MREGGREIERGGGRVEVESNDHRNCNTHIHRIILSDKLTKC